MPHLKQPKRCAGGENALRLVSLTNKTETEPPPFSSICPYTRTLGFCPNISQLPTWGSITPGESLDPDKPCLQPKRARVEPLSPTMVLGGGVGLGWGGDLGAPVRWVLGDKTRPAKPQVLLQMGRGGQYSHSPQASKQTSSAAVGMCAVKESVIKQTRSC